MRDVGELRLSDAVLQPDTARLRRVRDGQELSERPGL
jgi:hypothetical protein